MLASKLLGKWLAAWLGQQFFHLTGDECELCFGLTHAAAAGTLAVVTVGFHMGLLSPLVLNATVIMILLLCTLSSFVTEHAAKNLALAEEARLVSDRDEDEWIVFGEQHEQQKELALLAELREPEFVTTNGWTEITDTVEHSHRSMVVYHQSASARNGPGRPGGRPRGCSRTSSRGSSTRAARSRRRACAA